MISASALARASAGMALDSLRRNVHRETKGHLELVARGSSATTVELSIFRESIDMRVLHTPVSTSCISLDYVVAELVRRTSKGGGVKIAGPHFAYADCARTEGSFTEAQPYYTNCPFVTLLLQGVFLQMTPPNVRKISLLPVRSW